MSTFEPPPTEAARRDLLIASEEKGDGGELVGRDPRDVPPKILSHYHGKKSAEGHPGALSRLLLRRRGRGPQVCLGVMPELALPHGHQPVPRKARDLGRAAAGNGE
jgi:hypothetical protein